MDRNVPEKKTDSVNTIKQREIKTPYHNHEMQQLVVASGIITVCNTFDVFWSVKLPSRRGIKEEGC